MAAFVASFARIVRRSCGTAPGGRGGARYTRPLFRLTTAVFQRLFYTALLYLLTPLVLYRLAARGIKYHGYFARWRERFGFFADPGIRDSIWVHAVSLGEVNAAVPLIEGLMRRYGDS